MPSPPPYLCLDCRIAIGNPEHRNGFLRCPSGHRVQSLKLRPLWQVGILSFGVAFLALLIFIHLLLISLGGTAVWVTLIAVGIWSAYVAVRGTQFIRAPGAVGAIGRQYLVVGGARLIVVLVLTSLQLAGILS